MAKELPSINDVNWDDIAASIESASSMILGQDRTWEKEYEVDTHRDSVTPLRPLFCYNCCGAITHIHERTYKVTKEEGIEYESKTVEKFGAEIGVSLGYDKLVGVSAKGKVEITTSIAKKIDKKQIVETEEKLSFDGHARKCRKIYVPVGFITRLDIKGKVFFRRSYHIDLQGKLSWGEKEVDTAQLEFTLSHHVGTYGLRDEANDCEPCKDCGEPIVEHSTPTTSGTQPPHD